MASEASSAFSPGVRAAVFVRQKGVCAFCGIGLNKLLENTEMPYIEFHHVQPKAAGGKGDADNCVALCTYTFSRSRDGCHYHIHEEGRFKTGGVADPEYFKYSHGHEGAAHSCWVDRWRMAYG